MDKYITDTRTTVDWRTYSEGFVMKRGQRKRDKRRGYLTWDSGTEKRSQQSAE